MKMPCRLPDLWHLEKALTATGLMAAVLVVFAVFVVIGERAGWLAAILFAVTAMSGCVWIIVRFIPFSEHRKKT